MIRSLIDVHGRCQSMREDLHLIDDTTHYYALYCYYYLRCFDYLVSTTSTIQLPRQNRVVGGLLRGKEQN